MTLDIVSSVHFTAPHVFGVQLNLLCLQTAQATCRQIDTHHA